MPNCLECNTPFEQTNASNKYGPKKFCSKVCSGNHSNKQKIYIPYNQAMIDINEMLEDIEREWGPKTKITDGWVRTKIAAFIENKVNEGKSLFGDWD